MQGSAPYGYPVFGEVVFKIGDRDLAEMEEGGGEHGIRFADREGIRKMLKVSGAAGSDHGDADSFGYGRKLKSSFMSRNDFAALMELIPRNCALPLTKDAFAAPGSV